MARGLLRGARSGPQARGREPRACATMPRMNSCEQCGVSCKRRWCSQACNSISRRRGEQRACEQCAAPFTVRPCDARKGGGRFCSDRCRRINFASNAVNYEKAGKRAVHRLVAAKMLGRPLRRGEVVHHVDGNIRNNDPSNLRVYESQAEHMREHAANGECGFTHEQAVEAGRLSGVSRARHRAPQRSS